MRPQTNEFHSIHKDGCPFMPDDSKRIFLGNFISPSDAGMAGKRYFRKSCACRYCTTDSVKTMTSSDTGSFRFFPTDNQIKAEGLYYLLN
jgi:hypothetical protein